MSVRSWGAGMVSYFSCVQLCVTLWTVTCQVPLSMGFSRQDYWSGLPFPSPGDLPDPGIKPVSLTSPALTNRFFTIGATWEALQLGWSEVKSLSGVQLFETPWTVAYQAPQSMEFSRQEYWSGLPFPAPGDLPNPGIEPESPALQADALPSEPPGLIFLLLSYLSGFPGGSDSKEFIISIERKKCIEGFPHPSYLPASLETRMDSPVWRQWRQRLGSRVVLSQSSCRLSPSPSVHGEPWTCQEEREVWGLKTLWSVCLGLSQAEILRLPGKLNVYTSDQGSGWKSSRFEVRQEYKKICFNSAHG